MQYIILTLQYNSSSRSSWRRQSCCPHSFWHHQLSAPRSQGFLNIAVATNIKTKRLYMEHRLFEKILTVFSLGAWRHNNIPEKLLLGVGRVDPNRPDIAVPVGFYKTKKKKSQRQRMKVTLIVFTVSQRLTWRRQQSGIQPTLHFHILNSFIHKIWTLGTEIIFLGYLLDLSRRRGQEAAPGGSWSGWL